MENNIAEQSSLTPPLKAIVVNGKKKVAVNGVVNLNLNNMKGGVQADWNQNDENAPDYIKNRICYEETSNVVLFENTVEYTIHQFNGSAALEELPNPFQFEEGKQYTVTKDGVVYVLTAQSIGGEAPSLFYGNIYKHENGSWRIGVDEERLVILEYADVQLVSTTLKIVGLMETIQKIDEQFLPDQNNVIFSWEHESQKNIQLRGNCDLSHNDSFNVYSATELTINDFTSYGLTYDDPEGLPFTYDENNNTYTSVSRMPSSGFESNDCVVCVATKNQETNKYTLYKVDSWIYDSSTNLITMELVEGPETDANFFIVSGIAAGEESIAIGNRAVCNSNCVAIGIDSVANSKDGGSTAIGNNSFSAYYSVAIGRAKASGDYAISVGEGSKASGEGAISCGYYSNAKGDHSIALLGGTTNNEGEIAIGNSWGSSAATSQTLIKFDRTTTPPTMKVSFDNGSTWGTVQITF